MTTTRSTSRDTFRQNHFSSYSRSTVDDFASFCLLDTTCIWCRVDDRGYDCYSGLVEVVGEVRGGAGIALSSVRFFV